MLMLQKWKLLTKKEHVVVIALWAGGLALLTLGVVLTINGHLGAGGVDAFNFALSAKLGVPKTVSTSIMGVTAILLAGLVRRGRPNFVAYAASLTMGVFLDLWNVVLKNVQGVTFAGKCVITVAGLLCIALAVALTMCSIFPGSPVDDLLKAFVERGRRAWITKIVIEGVCAGLAYLLGGELGIGTVLVVFGLGPFIDLFRGMCTKMNLDVDARVRKLLEAEGERNG